MISCTFIDRRNIMANLLYKQSFADTAKFYRCVIALRYPSPAGQGLLQDGHAAKSFAIKAKSSANGPTAGFVACDPQYVKGDPSGHIKQNQYISKALSNGARSVPLILSPVRINWLLSAGLTSRPGPDCLQAHIHNVCKTFIIKPGEDDATGMLQVFNTDGSIVEVLANPPHIKGPRDFRCAVTADYDLFGIFPRTQQSVNIRPMQPVARVLHRAGATPMRAAEKYLDGIRQASGQPECPDTGNISPFIKAIVHRLNAAIVGEGYRGGDLIQHSDENGNPFSGGEDFPLLFFFPEGDQIMIHENSGLNRVIVDMASRGYASIMNPAFNIQGPDGIPGYRRQTIP